MKIYIAIWNDRRADTTAHPFEELSDAIIFCDDMANEYCRHQEDLKVKQNSCWNYYIEYSCDGDCLWVTEHEI